jgi:hypothetical protein
VAVPFDASTGERRSRLRALKLGALVRDHLGLPDVAAVEPFAPGAGALVGAEAWVLLDDEPGRRLGAALAWSLQRDAGALHVVVDDAAGLLARRAAEFDVPISVWSIDGRRLVAADPVPLAPPVPVPPEHLELVDLITAGGAIPVVEHGVLRGEVRGLEVCRVVDDPYLDVVRLEVGVGAHDREAFQIMHGDVPTLDALRRVVDAVTSHRTTEVPDHPLNRLGRERLLRWRLEQEPHLVGAATLAPAEPPVPRVRVDDPVPCVAHGVAHDGSPITVVCSTGVDLDVVPYAADARLAAAGAGASGVGVGRTVIALPARDLVPVTIRLAALLRQSVELVSID